MIIKEYRVVLPMTVDEYQVAQLYSVAQASKNETGGGEGIEVLKNEPFALTEGVQPKTPLLNGNYTSGQFTHKIYHLASKVPKFARALAPKGSMHIHEEAWNAFPYCRTVVSILLTHACINWPLAVSLKYLQEGHPIPHSTSVGTLLTGKVPTYILWLAPKGSLEIHEEAWNAFPYCRTVITNPDYMKENFIIKIETMHLPDRGDTENAHGLDADTLRQREVVRIDIAHDPVDRRDYKADEDPTTFKSQKTGRGPLNESGWEKKCAPVMCCYKLVTVEFKWWGLQGKVEKFIHKAERRIFTNFHRQVFCWTDQWYGMTMADIRALEDKTKVELDEQRKKGPVRGTKEDGD